MKLQFSWITAIIKATLKTVTPLLIIALTLVAENPQLINKILGNLSTITLATAVLWVVQLLLNWLKNKDLGK